MTATEEPAPLPADVRIMEAVDAIFHISHGSRVTGRACPAPEIVGRVDDTNAMPNRQREDWEFTSLPGPDLAALMRHIHNIAVAGIELHNARKYAGLLASKAAREFDEKTEKLAQRAEAKRCDGCANWAEPPTTDHGRCAMVGWRSGSGAYIDADRGGEADFMTPPDFSCSKWEANS